MNAPDDADTRGLTGLFSRLAVLSKQLLWISHSTLTDNIQVTLHLGISSLVSLLGVIQAWIRTHDFPCGISDTCHSATCEESGVAIPSC